MTHPYLAIEGAIGVGKTTLARWLHQSLQAELLLEVFEENPFLSQFYADRDRYAFQTQIFFLLSRYGQQHQVIPQTLHRGPLVSDYLFDKDHLFAQLNLSGDELEVYHSVYQALAERIPTPSLLVYLQANVDTLLERIAIRDRPYERNMNRTYIADLNHAYEQFISTYTAAPVIIINTDDLNLVQDVSARQAVIGRIKAALEQGITQPSLPNLAVENPAEGLSLPDAPRLPQLQAFHRQLDVVKEFDQDLYLNFACLVEEVGELGSELRHVWQSQQSHQQVGQTLSRAESVAQHRQALGGELADCLGYLLKLANYTGIDLETVYLEKMRHNVSRTWAHQLPPAAATFLKEVAE